MIGDEILLAAIKHDLEERAEDGVVPLSNRVWLLLCERLTKEDSGGSKEE